MSFCRVKGCRHASSHVTMGHRCGRCSFFGHGQYECDRYPERKKLYAFADGLPEHLKCRRAGCGHSELHTTEGHECSRCGKIGSNCKCDEKRATCPICRKESVFHNIDGHKIFGVNQNCCICMANEVNIVFPECKHACACLECVTRLAGPEVDPTGAAEEPAGPPDEREHVLTSAKERLRGRDMTWCVEYVGQGCAWYIKVVAGVYDMFFLHGDNHGQYGPDTNDIPRLRIFLEGCTELEN